MLGPTAAMSFIVLGDEIWSPEIHRPKFVARAFPSFALTHRLLQKGFVLIVDISKVTVVVKHDHKKEKNMKSC